MANLKFITLLSLATASLVARVPLEDKIQEMNIYLEEAQFQLNHHKVEIDLFQERLSAMEANIQKKLEELSALPKSSTDAAKLALLEERQKALTQDIGKIGKQQVELISNLTKLEFQMNEKMSKINKSISQLLSLVEQKPQSYTVQSGDSLGKIAAEFRIPLEELKKINQLTSNNIYVGQKLRIP